MPEKPPLDPQIFGRLGRDGYTIEKVLLETMPGYYLAGNLYRPRGRTGKLPAVLKPQQNDRPEVAERAARTGTAPR